MLKMRMPKSIDVTPEGRATGSRVALSMFPVYQTSTAGTQSGVALRYTLRNPLPPVPGQHSAAALDRHGLKRPNPVLVRCIPEDDRDLRWRLFN